tara:strand:+ start:134 stop:352 length:219 start_codon:yes stop_codon:yes gene_type:complete
MEKDSPFSEITYLTLSPEAQDKVYLLYNIASILHHNNIAPITPREFDELYDKQLIELEEVRGIIISNVLNMP